MLNFLQEVVMFSMFAHLLYIMWQVYWEMGAPDATVPDAWEKSLSTSYNMNTPMNLTSTGLVYLSVSYEE